MLLMRNANDEQIKGKWVFPGGHIDSDADVISALAREVKEETNLKISSAWVFKTAIKKYPDGLWRYVVYYICEANGSFKLSEEHDAFEWADLKTAKKMQFRDNEEKQLVMDLIKRKNSK